MTYFTTLSIEGSLSNQIFRNINGVEELQNAVLKYNHKAVILFFYPESDKKSKQIVIKKIGNNSPEIKSSKDLLTLVSKLEKNYPTLKTDFQRPSVSNSILGQCSETKITIKNTTISISDFGVSYDKELGKKVATLFACIFKSNQSVWNGNIFGKPIDELVELIIDKVENN